MALIPGRNPQHGESYNPYDGLLNALENLVNRANRTPRDGWYSATQSLQSREPDKYRELEAALRYLEGYIR